MRPLRSVNPATGRPIRDWPEHDDAAVARLLASLHTASTEWAARPVGDREGPVRAFANLLRKEAAPLAARMAEEMGKPLAQGRAEAEKCALACDWFADHAASAFAPAPVAGGAPGWRETVVLRPVGPVLAIMPWNFPLWQVIRCAAPAWLAGNGVLLKHAETVQGCAAALEDLAARAGLPHGLLQVLRVRTERVAPVISSPVIRSISFTGSTRGGRAVAQLAGAALKRTVLELGGSDPYVVLADAEVDRAVAACTAGRLLNSGQSCIAAKRFVVTRAVLPRFTEGIVETFRAKRWGDPAEDGVDVGPLAREDLRDALHDQVTRSVARGARLLLGGAVPERPGFFYPPTVLSDVGPGMPAYDEETFGPVAAILPAADDADALRIANDTAFGLGAAVFTADRARGERLAAEVLEAGAVFVNDFVRSDPRMPFGGVKDSGWGRELSEWGMREFVVPKSVAVAP